MTVAEYIAALQQLPQDHEVVAWEVNGFSEASLGAHVDVMHRDHGAYYRCWRNSTCGLCERGLPLVEVVIL